MTTRCTGQTADQYINRLATVGLQGQYRLTAVTKFAFFWFSTILNALT